MTPPTATATVAFTLNGQSIHRAVEPDTTLLWLLRAELGLTGTKFGCGEGYCGCCTVLVDRQAVRACNIFAADVNGKTVVTIEGLASGGQLHPLQKAFMAHDALQCGFCTPGMILTAFSLLQGNPRPTRQQIIEGMDQNLCRCGAHVRIVQAIQTAAAEMNGGAA
jgi:aerobic-type carbon monoxide dehydrogenase small subunit (CoxS/CutS family)